MNIILIDNVDSNRAVLRHLLECVDLHLTLHEFDDPEAALDWCIHYRPDAVVIDNHLPSMDGLEFAQLFRLQPEHRDVPILLISMDTGVLTRRTVGVGCVAEVLLKPARPQDVVERLSILLQERLRKTLGADTQDEHNPVTARSLQKSMQDLWKKVVPHPGRSAHKSHTHNGLHHARPSHATEHRARHHSNTDLGVNGHAQRVNGSDEQPRPKARVIPLHRRRTKTDAGNTDSDR